MKVEQLMTKAVHACRPEDRLSEAARLMWEHDCGAVPVVSSHDHGSVVGMITDRDICMAAYFTGRRLSETAVGDVMSKEVRSCHAGDSLSDAAAIMRAGKVRRLPVVDDANQLQGVLSIADLAREARRGRGSKRRHPTEAQVGDTLATISEPGAVG
jgi:CBS domain-containing protein